MPTKVESKAAHTPGPWKAGFIADSSGKLVWQAIERPDRFSIATVGRYLHRYEPNGGRRAEPKEISPEEAAANAQLMAAAPELLAALKAMMDVQDSTDDCWCDDDVRPCEACMARAAIAQATGTK